MGNQYCITTGDLGTPTTEKNMRIFCQRPGKKDADGKTIYFTEQAHKNLCDINQIIRKYDTQGVITHIQKINGKFGDLTGYDFKLMQDKVANARSMFQELPSSIRSEFDNDAAQLLEFMDNPDNRDKAIELGLIDKNWTPETDGIGETVPSGGNVDPAKEAAKLIDAAKKAASDSK